MGDNIQTFPKHHIRYIGVTDGIDTWKDDALTEKRKFLKLYTDYGILNIKKDTCW